MSTEIYKGQRNKEKYELFKRFRVRAIEDVYKKNFFALFDNKCFKCGAEERPSMEIGKPPVLCMDHHIPMALGGHLEPGNIVALCRKCNNAKLDKPPEEFYSGDELQRLQPILEKQNGVFEFEFDWNQWNEDREKYLISLGIEPGLVRELLFNEEHPDFIGMPSDTVSVTISVDISEILGGIEKR